MQTKRAKNQPVNERQSSSESFYNEAFKLFAQGFSNQKIEKYNPKGSELTITQLLQPSIEMVLDEIEGKVTKNVKFQKTTSYFIKRKQFISDIINRRNSKGFNRDQMQFFNEFLKICEYYHQNRSLNEYVYLKLELIFDKIYYSDKKKENNKAELLEDKKQEEEQKEEEKDGEEIYQVRPKKRERERKVNQEATVVVKPKEEKRLIVSKPKQEKKAAMPQSKEAQQPTPLFQAKNFSSELQRKKKDLQVLELQHQILLKRSKMLQVQEQINQIQSEMNRFPQLINNPLPTSNKNTSPPASKKKEPIKLVIRQPIKQQQQPSQTIISSDSINPAKVEEQEQQEEEQEIEEIEEVDDDDDDESQYQVKRLNRKKSILKPKSKRKRNKAQKWVSIIDFQVKSKPPIISKSDPKIPQKKLVQQTQEIQPLPKPSKPLKTKSRPKRTQKPLISRQDYFSRHWKPQQQKLLVSQLQSINIMGLSTVQSQLIKHFGKKQRFRVTSIKQKKATMFKECRKKFLNELQKRQLVSDEQFKNVVQHLHCLDNRATFDFTSKFLQNYYFSDIDIMLNKAIKDTYTAILKLKKRPKHYNKDSSDWQENVDNAGESQSFYPSHQESSHPTDPVNRNSFKRQITRLGITENDIVETRKVINFNKQTKEHAAMREQGGTAKECETYFEEGMEEEQQKVKEETGNEEGKGAKMGANMKSAFQKYIEDVKDK